MAGTGSGRINPAGSCLPDIRPDSRIRKFEKAGYPGSGDPAKTPIRWNPKHNPRNVIKLLVSYKLYISFNL